MYSGVPSGDTIINSLNRRKEGKKGGREGRKKGGRERKYFSFINETVRWFIRGIIQVYRLERNTDKRAWIKNKAKHPSVASEIA